MFKLILVGFLALGGAGFLVLGAVAGSPHTSLVLVCDRDGVSATATVLLSSDGGGSFPQEVTLTCDPGARRNSERLVAFNADYARVTQFLATKPGDSLDCAPIEHFLPLKAVCFASPPNASLTVR